LPGRSKIPVLPPDVRADQGQNDDVPEERRRRIMDEVKLLEGKYTFHKSDYEGSLICLRYGDPWRRFVGDKAVHALFDECVDLRNKLAEKDAALKKAEGEPVRLGFLFNETSGITDIFTVDEDGDEIDREVDAECLLEMIASYHKRVETAESELAPLRAYKADIEAATKMIMDEKCPSDEKHCTCVPLLRAKLETVYEGIEEALDYARDEETCRMVIPALEQIVDDDSETLMEAINRVDGEIIDNELGTD
jgi:hypothetical protein